VNPVTLDVAQADPVGEPDRVVVSAIERREDGEHRLGSLILHVSALRPLAEAIDRYLKRHRR
jgi:hypothetical protein